MRKIKQLLLSVGENTQIYNATDEKPIVQIEKNGEMALVIWYVVGNKEEVNGKYVISVIYE
jgi:hypothetical protein